MYFEIICNLILEKKLVSSSEVRVRHIFSTLFFPVISTKNKKPSLLSLLVRINAKLFTSLFEIPFNTWQIKIRSKHLIKCRNYQLIFTVNI